MKLLLIALLLQTGKPPIRIAFVGDTASGMYKGAALGAEEARRTAALLGRTLDFIVVKAPRPDVQLYVSATPRATSFPAGSVVLTTFIDRRCSNFFRLVPPFGDEMFFVWSHRLERFGAAQLNERFRHKFGTVMTIGSWAGWFAVKVLAESALRTTNVEAHLLSPRTVFDGHKGKPLRFDPQTRMLIQPLYRVPRVGEVTEHEPVLLKCSR